MQGCPKDSAHFECTGAPAIAGTGAAAQDIAGAGAAYAHCSSLRCRANNKAVAAQLGVAQQTVSKWRNCFVLQRLVGLLDAPRPGPPPRMDTERTHAVLAHMLAIPPAGTRRWTTRSLAQAVDVSQATVARMWRAHGIQVDWLQRLRLALGAWRLALGVVHVAGMPGWGLAVQGLLGLLLDPALRLVAWQLLDGAGQGGAQRKQRQ